MKMQKNIAIIMLLTGSTLTALVCGDIAYPAILCILGFLGLQRRVTWDIKPQRRVIKSLLLLLLTIMFALHYKYTGLPSRVAYVEAAGFAWQTITRYFLASMVLILFLGPPERLPSSLGLFHIAIAISAGQVLLIDDRYIFFRLSELLSVIMVVLYAAAARGSMNNLIPERVGRMSTTSCFRKKAGVLAFSLILLITVNCGWVIGSILYRHVEVINYLPVRFWRWGLTSEKTTEGLSHVGFSTSGKLSSILLIKGNLDSTPVLSITCDSSPGYLRARAFDIYRQSEWHDLSYREALFPEQNRPFGMYFVGRTNLFRLNKSDASKYNYMTIRHEFRFSDTVFTPFGTIFLEAPLNLLLRDDDNIVYARNLRGDLSYGIGYTQAAYQEPPNRLQARPMLNTPPQLDPRIHQLASRIFTGCNTTTEKIVAVVNYFRTNFTYSLELDIPPDQDKLTHFLLEESAGYCEYFASGAAILLRLAGVPTRYVTGFLVTERDPQGESWIAQNMDAHAWVEAWDQERNRWTIVEATVGEYLSTAASTEQLEPTHSGIGALLGQLQQAIYQYGLFGLLGWLFSYGVLTDKSYGLLAGLLLTILFGGALSLALSRYYSRKKSKEQILSRVARNPELVALHKMLIRMDRKVKTAGRQRHVCETLHAFSKRLLAQDSGDGLWIRISNWYLEYANLRYRRKISYKRLEQLQQHAQGL
ncbi:MAG: transglutaminase-like domain-containing protein [Planctomycetota bacterium]|jgi:transglutaminase-like putative cysteine protease